MNSAHNTSVNDVDSGYETYGGDFDVTYYSERGTEISVFAKIQLRNIGEYGYHIDGNCSTADEGAIITEGFVTYSGDAWWVETFSNGIKVLTEGKFDFLTNTFTGTWRKSTGVRSCYTEFKGKNMSITFRSGGAVIASNPQTIGEMLVGDIPMAVATLETPVVTAAPVFQAVPESTLTVRAELTVPTASAVPIHSAPPAEHLTSNQDIYVSCV